MAERYQIISHNDNRMYQNDCPVICCAYNILLDTVTEDLLLQMKFDNLNTIPVRELTLSVDCFDVSGLLLSSDVELNYIVNDGSYRKPFGSDNAKNLPNNKTRKIAFKISSIVFADGSTWHTENSEYMKIVAEQIKAADHLVSAELIKEYELLTPDIHHERKWPVFENGYWLCACGEINLNNKPFCSNCKLQKETLQTIIDTDFISQNAERRKVEQEKKNKKQAELNAKKLKKLKTVALISITISLVILLIVKLFIIPNITAKELMKFKYEMLPEAEGFEEITVGVDSVTEAYKATNGVGYVFYAQGKGFGGDGSVKIAIAYDSTGNITNIKVFDCSAESQGIGDKIVNEKWFTAQFIGIKGEAILGKNVDAIAGSTISCLAFVEAVNNSYTAFNEIASNS